MKYTSCKTKSGESALIEAEWCRFVYRAYEQRERQGKEYFECVQAWNGGYRVGMTQFETLNDQMNSIDDSIAAVLSEKMWRDDTEPDVHYESPFIENEFG